MSDFRRRAIKKVIHFNVMVVGVSGIGKSTFINTLCNQNLVPLQSSVVDPTVSVTSPTMSITPYSVDIDEEGVKMQLNIVDTPGFGDSLDNTSNFQDILLYIERQYDDVLEEESKIKRNPKTVDGRVHLLLYFIYPNGHGLSEIDITALKTLCKRVNIIPLIGRADTLTAKELENFKKTILSEIATNNIRIYDFPFDEENDEPEMIAECKEFKEMIPFSVIGSTETFQNNGRTIRGRRYPWGFVDTDNHEHSDFPNLRYVILKTHYDDMKEVTQNELYENYRSEKLSTADSIAENVSSLALDGNKRHSDVNISQTSSLNSVTQNSTRA